MSDSDKRGRGDARQSTFAWSATETSGANHIEATARLETSAPAEGDTESTGVGERPPRSASPKRQKPPKLQTTLAAGDRWLTPDEAFIHLGLPTRKALYAAVARGQVPVHRWNTRLRFARSELDALLQNGR